MFPAPVATDLADLGINLVLPATLLLIVGPFWVDVSLKLAGASLQDRRNSRRYLSSVILLGLAVALPAAWLDRSSLNAVMHLCFGVVLACAAWVDRQSAWAPDGLVLPICLLAGSLSEPLAVLSAEAYRLLAGLALYLLAQLAWFLQCRWRRPALPPPDLIALALPLFVFGPNPSALGVYGAFVITVAAVRLSPAIWGIFGNRQILDLTAQSIGLRADRPIAFLAIALPLMAIAQSAGAYFGSRSLPLF